MTSSSRPGDTYRQQLAERVSALLPGISPGERLELIGAMDPGDMRACLAWLSSFAPGVFDFAVARDETLTVRLYERLAEEPYEDGLDPYCSACGESIGIFLGHGKGWHHYRGGGSPENPTELYDAGHEPAAAWRQTSQA